MKENTLKAEIRKKTGKGAARKERAQGKIPGVVYGEGSEPVAFTVSDYDLTQMITKSTKSSIILDLELEGGDTRKVLLTDLQTDPVQSDILSVDFLQISMDKEIVIQVPVELQGTPDGVKNQGGILQPIRRVVEISCLPGDIPDKITLDVSEMQIGDTLHVEDLKFEKFTIREEPHLSICTVVAPTVVKEKIEEVEGEELAEGEEAAAEGEEGGESAEPEVIGEKKEDKE